ncbi:MAG: hypothetical protein JEZ03_04050 [Bacteroidales bacterium]|nr:hypothetical protein [Bacteroidales bacterium]
MIRQEFDKLTLEKRTHIVFNDGFEVMDRIFLFYQIRLYSLNDFYVEIWYRQIGNKVDKVESLDINDVTHLYGKEIDISGLFK